MQKQMELVYGDLMIVWKMRNNLKMSMTFIRDLIYIFYYYGVKSKYKLFMQLLDMILENWFENIYITVFIKDV